VGSPTRGPNQISSVKKVNRKKRNESFYDPNKSKKKKKKSPSSIHRVKAKQMATYSGKIIVWLLFFCPSLYKKKEKKKKRKKKKRRRQIHL
jgi:hypothetical protein